MNASDLAMRGRYCPVCQRGAEVIVAASVAGVRFENICLGCIGTQRLAGHEVIVTSRLPIR